MTQQEFGVELRRGVAMPATELTESESLEHLSRAVVGRLVTVVDGAPHIHPVSHTVADGVIFFRTLPGDKLHGVAVNASVLFEADELSNGAAWSVVVRGLARRIDDDPDELAAVLKRLRPAFVGGHRDAVVRIIPQSITGRLFTPDSTDEAPAGYRPDEV